MKNFPPSFNGKPKATVFRVVRSRLRLAVKRRVFPCSTVPKSFTALPKGVDLISCERAINLIHFVRQIQSPCRFPNCWDSSCAHSGCVTIAVCAMFLNRVKPVCLDRGMLRYKHNRLCDGHAKQSRPTNSPDFRNHDDEIPSFPTGIRYSLCKFPLSWCRAGICLRHRSGIRPF